MYRVDNNSGEDKWNNIGIKIEESKKKNTASENRI